LAAKDEDLIAAEAVIDCEKIVAKNPHYAEKQIISQLSKLNSTPFTSNQILFHTQQKYFISVSILNELRRNVVENLIQNRLKYFTAEKIQFVKKDCEYPTKSVDFTANIINQKAVEFYKRHKVVEFEFGFERQEVVTSRRILLRSKYCIKYELEMCQKYFQDREILNNEDLFLENGKNKFKLEFDCQKCEMLLF
jgi:putative protease